MKKYCIYLLGLLATLAVSCTVEPAEVVSVGEGAYTAVIEAAAPSTRTVADENLHVLWSKNDELSIFDKSSWNGEYKLEGEGGTNTGVFTKVEPSGYVAGVELPLVYAVYPYNANNTISNDGVVSVTLPAEQTYAPNSFGPGAATMASIAVGKELKFKNMCGFFAISLCGTAKVKTITFKGNDNEVIAGPATITGAEGEIPTLTMAAEGGKEITLNCTEPVRLGTSPETATVFWFALPPTTFAKGITINVTDANGRTFEKSTTGALEIVRNTKKSTEPLEAFSATKPMFAKFSNMLIRVNQVYNNQNVWYGTVDNYADRDDVDNATWTTSDPTVVDLVTYEGKPNCIKGIAPGKAQVTVEDAEGNYIVIPVEVMPLANKDYDYNYGIELLSNKDLYDPETGLGWNGNGTRFLGDGYAEGTQCYHVKDLHREDPKTGSPKIVYLISQAKFEPVDISAIEHPALYLRLYVSNVDILHMDNANSQIELSSNGADNSEELTWTGGRVFTNWEGQYGEPKFQLKNGWNNIVLPLEYAEGGSEFRPKKVNWFRMYHNPAATYDMTGKDIEFAIDQLRIVDWTEFDTCDNFDQWFDGGTGNNRPCFRAVENLDGHAKVFGAVNDLITGPISNFRIKEWAGRVYSLPVNMDSQNAVFSWWFWVVDAEWFNQCHIKAELSSENVNDAHNWAWGKNPGELNLQNGWNKITYDFKDAEDQSGSATKRTDRKINYFRIVVTPQGGAKSSLHTYYIDDLRVSKK